MKAPVIPVSWGELIDKLTILEIKAERLRGEAALANVRRELDVLGAVAATADARELAPLRQALAEVNGRLWQVEDEIRAKEAAKAFDAAFVKLARSVYRLNDERAALKRRINALLGSEIVEEKSYRDY